jgi:hypothetical protein
LIPVNPRKIPYIEEEELQTYPVGYKFLAYFQEAHMKVAENKALPGHRRENDSINGQAHDLLYLRCKEWVEGEDPNV